MNRGKETSSGSTSSRSSSSQRPTFSTSIRSNFEDEDEAKRCVSNRWTRSRKCWHCCRTDASIASIDSIVDSDEKKRRGKKFRCDIFQHFPSVVTIVFAPEGLFRSRHSTDDVQQRLNEIQFAEKSDDEPKSF